MELYKSGKINRMKDQYGFKFSKNLGQNFLTDPNIISKIIDGSFIDENTLVLEIGPGMGALTEGLLDTAGHVVAVELDRRLIPILEDNFAGRDNFSLINADILKVDIDEIIVDVCEKTGFKPEKIRIVGNLPYYITTPIIMNILENGVKADSITVMMQKEVGDRMMADPGTKAYGALSLAVGYFCEVSQVAKAPKEVFYPRPKVDSIVLRLDLRDQKPVDLKSEELFFKVIKNGFGQRRKTMNNSLAGVMDLGKDRINEILSSVGIDGVRRAETLSMQEFAEVANAIFDSTCED